MRDAADPLATLAGMNPSTTAFIGGGNMASAILGGLRAGGRPASSLIVIEPVEAQRDRLRQAARAKKEEGTHHAKGLVHAVFIPQIAPPCAETPTSRPACVLRATSPP